MTKSHSTAPADPGKPYPEFPLTAHPAGYWCKKIRGKIHYFGPWDDPDGALAKYPEQKDALHAGRTPRPDTHLQSGPDQPCSPRWPFCWKQEPMLTHGSGCERAWSGPRCALVVVSGVQE